MARIGINGFGRIGRYLVRLMAERNEFPVVINARADNALWPISSNTIPSTTPSRARWAMTKTASSSTARTSP